MIRKPVVFVVGAGASSEVGLPTGAQLRMQLAKDVDIRFKHYSELASGSPDVVDAMRIVSGGNINPMREAGVRLSPVLKLQPSVDEALHFLSSDELAVRLGKLAVAHRILNAEGSSGVIGGEGRADLSAFDPPPDNWLFQFASLALAGLRRGEIDTAFDNVAIINFNYDRSLEQFLYLSLQRHGAADEEAARSAVAKLRILRPYGSLGPLPWQAQDGIWFGQRTDRHQIIVRAANNIRTFTEGFTDTSLGEEISGALRNAHLVVFLGFGYHRQNMELLSIGEQRDARNDPEPTVLATKQGIHDENNGAVGRLISESLLVHPERLRLLNMPAHELLASLWPTIMEIVG